MSEVQGMVDVLNKQNIKELFAVLYEKDSNVINDQIIRYQKLISNYQTHFGVVEDIQLFSVPGRTEICGNHRCCER